MSNYQQKRAQLQRTWRRDGGQLRLSKSTISNLFRYQPSRYRSSGAALRRLPLGGFDDVVALETHSDGGGTLDVEGLATYEAIVDHCLARGFMPLVAPELKHITVGGATVGIGIESSCFRHGFVHDGLIEADVLLPDGSVVTCTAENEYADLFNALPNSYGTLGYILRAKIALQRAAPYVNVRISRFGDSGSYLDAIRAATQCADVDFIDGLLFEYGRYFLMTGRFVDQVPSTDDIVREHIFYKLVQIRGDLYLTARDYIFRYDPEWFWNIPESWPYMLFRRYAPRRFRNSSFYTRYAALKNELLAAVPGSARSDTEPLIQDWQVPWKNAAQLIEFCIANVRLDGRPWAAVPIRTPRRPTLYPIAPGELYFNLGCYCQVRKPSGKEDFYYTKIIDRLCFELGGIKMLYSSSFLDEEEFGLRYNGPAYESLKAKYDREGNAPTLYSKVAVAL